MNRNTRDGLSQEMTETLNALSLKDETVLNALYGFQAGYFDDADKFLCSLITVLSKTKETLRKELSSHYSRMSPPPIVINTKTLTQEELDSIVKEQQE